MIRGSVTIILLFFNLAFWGTPVMILGLFKFVLRGEPRRRVVLAAAELADRYVGGNDVIYRWLLPIVWDVELPDGLDPRGHYLIFSNHVSWADILVLFRIFHRRVALTRFFVKQELIWLPLVGQLCWVMDFPFMKRFSPQHLERHPEDRGKDLETTRRFCQRYRAVPLTILNFLEGTRFTPEKSAAQGLPYRHLLRPRAGGAAFVLASLGDQLDGVVDVAIAYHGPRVTFWDFLCGRIPRVTVRTRMLNVPPEFYTAAVVEPEQRAALKVWLERLWAEKDALLDRTLAQPAVRSIPAG